MINREYKNHALESNPRFFFVTFSFMRADRPLWFLSLRCYQQRRLLAISRVLRPSVNFFPNLDIQMIISLANYRPFSALFVISLLGRVLANLLISMQALVMAEVVDEMFICSKIFGPNLSEMQFRTFALRQRKYFGANWWPDSKEN